jgi:pimeloyl-ACP methyl ester carboxylesterase
LTGALSQMAAVPTHKVSPSRLRSIALSIPKVLIITGDQDNLVNPQNSLYLKEHIPEAELVILEQTGHAINLQRNARFNDLLEDVIREGRERVLKEQGH